MFEEEVCNTCKKEGKTDPKDCPVCIQMHKDYAKIMGKESPVESIYVNCTYYGSTSTLIELPLYISWEDIEGHYIKWNIFCYKLKDEDNFREIELSYDYEIGDMKHPDGWSIYDEDYNGKLDSS